MTDEHFGDAWRLERRDSGVRVLTLDRPGSSQNSLDRMTLIGLGEAATAVARDPSATLLAIRSSKPKGFCAGADLKAFRPGVSAVELRGLGHLGVEAFDAIAGLGIPTAAILHGPCLGGGLEMALACRARLAIAGGGATLGAPEVRLGLIPGWDGVGRLTRLLGLEPAIDLLLSGRAVEAEEANRIGLVDAIVAEGRIDAELDHLAGIRATVEPAPWPPKGWEGTLAGARETVNRGPEESKRAREILLDVVEADLTRGRDAGREAAVLGLATLAQSPEARAAIARFFDRPDRK